MTTERRRYYRIDDAALIKYRVIAAEQLALEKASILGSALRGANIRMALAPFDNRLQELLQIVRQENRAVAEAIDLLNRKLAVLADILLLEQGASSNSEYREHEPSTINVSGGGLGIQAAAPLALNADLVIDFVLLPSNYPMRAIGRVIDCRKQADDSFYIGIEFAHMREEDRDLLVQHIVRKQAEALRAARVER